MIYFLTNDCLKALTLEPPSVKSSCIQKGVNSALRASVDTLGIDSFSRASVDACDSLALPGWELPCDMEQLSDGWEMDTAKLGTKSGENSFFKKKKKE